MQHPPGVRFRCRKPRLAGPAQDGIVRHSEARKSLAHLAALSDRSRRPVRYANQLPQQIESLIVRLKAEKPYGGARNIRELLSRRLDECYLAIWIAPSGINNFTARNDMTARLHYGTTAKLFHWLIVGLLLIQFPIGWFMPDIHDGVKPGRAMTFHISFGITILVLIVLRFVWRLTHPVAPESALPAWQRLSSEGVHWLLYALMFATTATGWLFASFRGWAISYFFVVPLPMLAAESESGVHRIDGWHQIFEWVLLVVIGIHVAAALAHIFIYRDRIMQRMLPGVRS